MTRGALCIALAYRRQRAAARRAERRGDRHGLPAGRARLHGDGWLGGRRNTRRCLNRRYGHGLLADAQLGDTLRKRCSLLLEPAYLLHRRGIGMHEARIPCLPLQNNVAKLGICRFDLLIHARKVGLGANRLRLLINGIHAFAEHDRHIVKQSHGASLSPYLNLMLRAPSKASPKASPYEASSSDVESGSTFATHSILAISHSSSLRRHT